MEVVKLNWDSDHSSNPFLDFKRKIKKIKRAITLWSRITFGDIFQQLLIREEIAKIKEKLFEEDPSAENRMIMQRSKAEYDKYLHFEEIYWQQKAGYEWFEAGDRNTRFFHSLVKGRRQRMKVSRIKNDQGIWIEEEEQVAAEAVSHFDQQFHQDRDATDFSLLSHIPESITAEENEALGVVPESEEVKRAVFKLSGDSSSGPNGLCGSFFHVCWDIVGVDIINMVQDFFYDNTLPKSVTHSNLVLIPKKANVQTFSDMRPISLSNFVNNILSRIILDRLEGILPRLISSNQSGFVKGRTIIENVLLTQELVTDISKRGKPANVVIKLDMAKAYDRVSWFFLMKVLKKMGFDGRFVDMVWRLISNHYYSVLLNGQSYGFFHSTRGVKQGDPLSPALFILSSEVLSRALNSLFDDPYYVGYGMPKWSDNLNHLAYADDTIIFASTQVYSLKKIMTVLQEYEKQSGQMVNKEKSFFYLHQNVAAGISLPVEQCIGMNRGSFPMKYLGSPITHTRKRKEHYAELIDRVKGKLQVWKGKMLSYGGKEVLLKSVLQSIPVYVLSAITPPICVIKELHRIFAKFFWSTKESGRSKHWSEWVKMCIPKQEGGLGFRSIFDVSKALYAKLWWRFRTQNNLWSNFLWNKYCKKQIPSLVLWKRGSQVWKHMLENRVLIENHLWWEPKNGSSTIWYDNWSNLGPLHLHQSDFCTCYPMRDISDFLTEDGWNFSVLEEVVPDYVVQYIRSNMRYTQLQSKADKPW